MTPLTTHTMSPAPTEPELARTPPGEMKMPEPELFVPAPSSRNSLFWRELVSFSGFGGRWLRPLIKIQPKQRVTDN